MNVARKPEKAARNDKPLRRSRCRRRSDMSSSEKSDEENSNVAPDLGMRSVLDHATRRANELQRAQANGHVCVRLLSPFRR